MSVRISIIIPLFNKEKTVGETVRSVLSQAYNDFEVIVVNDGSTDHSEKAIEPFLQNPRVHYFNISNSGPGRARNIGAENAKGEFLLFLDADDLLLDGALKDFAYATEKYSDYSFFSASHYRQIGGKMHLYEYGEGVVRSNFKEWFMGKLCPLAGSFLYRREVFLQYRYQENLRLSEDIELLFRIFRHEKIVKLSFPSVIYRCDYCTASRAIPLPEQDYDSMFSPKGKRFWERVSLYELMLNILWKYPEYQVWRDNILYRFEHSFAARMRLASQKKGMLLKVRSFFNGS